MTTDDIARRARRLAVFTTALIGIVPLGILILLATGSVDMETVRMRYGIKLMPDDPGFGPTLVWLGVEALRLGLFLWLLWCVRGWLVACGQGRVFTGQTARHVQQMGTGLILLAVAQVVGNTVIIAALTWNNPEGQRSLAIGFGSAELLLLLAAGLMSLFGWIQSEAARLSAENEGFV